jgi:hypothetical protein
VIQRSFVPSAGRRRPEDFFLLSASLAEKSSSPHLPRDQLVLPVIRRVVIVADEKSGPRGQGLFFGQSVSKGAARQKIEILNPKPYVSNF